MRAFAVCTATFMHSKEMRLQNPAEIGDRSLRFPANWLRSAVAPCPSAPCTSTAKRRNWKFRDHASSPACERSARMSRPRDSNAWVCRQCRRSAAVAANLLSLADFNEVASSWRSSRCTASSVILTARVHSSADFFGSGSLCYYFEVRFLLFKFLKELKPFHFCVKADSGKQTHFDCPRCFWREPAVHPGYRVLCTPSPFTLCCLT